MLQSLATYATVAFAVVAAAQNTPPPVPENAQIGELAIPITCQILSILNQTFDATFTATAPLTGGAGQEIYYSDVVGNIAVPSYITDLANLIGATQAKADVTVNLVLDNASPRNLQAFSGTINNIPLTAGSDATIRIPAGTGTLSPLGPVTLGTAGTPHRIHLGTATVDLTLQNLFGFPILGPLPVQCPIQNINFIIGSVNVDNSQGPALQPAVGYVPTFPPTANLFESGGFRFPYDCSFGPLGTYTLDVEIAGTVPTFLSPGEQFSLTNAQSFLRIPSNLTTLAQTTFPAATNFQTNITEFNILFQNAQPSSFDVATTPISSTNAISSNLIIAIPNTGSLTVGPITAGQNGQIAGVAVGNAVATVDVLDGSGTSLISLPVNCAAPSFDLLGIPITDQEPEDYVLGFDQNNELFSLLGQTPTAVLAQATATAAATSAAATTTAATTKTTQKCLNNLNCLLSGGKCVRASILSLTGTCQ